MPAPGGYAMFPAPASSICGLAGFMARLPTYRLPRPLLMGVHVVPPSALFSTPTPPAVFDGGSEFLDSRSKIPVDAYIVFGLPGSNRRYRARLSPRHTSCHA